MERMIVVEGAGLEPSTQKVCDFSTLYGVITININICFMLYAFGMATGWCAVRLRCDSARAWPCHMVAQAWPAGTGHARAYMLFIYLLLNLSFKLYVFNFKQ